MGTKRRLDLRNDRMILSNDGIKKALEQGALEISPIPDETQYTTSAVDLHLGDEFLCLGRHEAARDGRQGRT